MKSFYKLLFLCFPAFVFTQNIRVDSQSYTPQQLVEDILINSTCIDNVVVTNVVGGDFGTADSSYGYFESNGNFPFQNGIVLSTGKIINTEGPNTSLSDDDAADWGGDNDLEYALNEQNTLNATILEFDFTSVASQISFRYIFASEEYQENNSNTCRYSDLFGFLIRPANEQEYENIALVPNTQTPVKVTTVHPEIPGGCSAINEFYFESWNGPNAPINFNGQTKILTATATVVPNQTYHVKLVIADEQNYRYDSAVFLEAGSFQPSVDIGPNRLISTNNALCEDETATLNAFQPGALGYRWSKDGVPQTSTFCLNCFEYQVTDPGVYSVEVILETNCIATGTAVVEYYPDVIVTDAILTECDQNQDGITLYDLFSAQRIITIDDQELSVVNYFLTENAALQNSSPIPNPNSFQNSTPNQIVFARVESIYGCSKVAELRLAISTNIINIPSLQACDDSPTDGYTDFNLNDIATSIQDQIPLGAMVSYYETEVDAFNNTNALVTPYRNITEDSQTIYVKVTSNNECFAISEANLTVLYTPTLRPDETVFYCLNSFPETVRIFGGVLNDAPSNYYYEWFFNGTTTSVNTSFYDINEAGVYTVIVTDPNGCSTSRIITVSETEIATIEDVLIQDGISNNTVTVLVSGQGFYEYALDDPNGFYQESNIFTNVPPGFHTIYVRDRNKDCGLSEQLISVLGFPKYFTPNGDTVHETWKIYGVSAQFNQGIDIKIYNRYGKLLAQQDHLSAGWDGTLKGKPLPSDDYWYVVTVPDGRVYRGHFSLVR
ncbi:MAG: choice-of-anchor L domain-containing protein [Aquaticitalea sp.]